MPSTSHGSPSRRTNAPSGSSASGASWRRCAARRIESLGVELRVDRVGSDLARMQVAPDRDEAVVVLAPAQRARAVAGGERGRLVEEEELRVPARLQQRSRAASRGTRAGRRSSACRVAPADAAVGVVEAAAVAVDEAARGIRDQLAERRDPVLEGAQTSPSNVSRR